MKAAVLYGAHQPLVVEELSLLPPQAGEVRVRFAASGVCHSDLHYIKGDRSCPMPVVLGHEGAGVVEEIGPGVSYVQPGDRLTRGQRYGFIRFGSRVDVYLPLASRVKVGIGDKVYATLTILAELP